MPEDRKKWMIVAGGAYLAALILWLAAEFLVFSPILADSSAPEATIAIRNDEQLYRVGLGLGLLLFVAVTARTASLGIIFYVKKPNIALLGLMFGLAEAVAITGFVSSDFRLLRLVEEFDLVGDPTYMTLVPLAKLYMIEHWTAYNLRLFFMGLASTIFAYLWVVSGHIPRSLAILGLLSSLWASACAFAFVISPSLHHTITIVAYLGPILLFDLLIGLWLVAAPLRPKP